MFLENILQYVSFLNEVAAANGIAVNSASRSGVVYGRSRQVSAVQAERNLAAASELLINSTDGLVAILYAG